MLGKYSKSCLSWHRQQRKNISQCLDWSIEQTEHPVAIKLPGGEMVSDGKQITKDFSALNKYEMTQQGKKVAFIGLGTFYSLAVEAAAELEKKTGVKPTVINPYYITGTDEQMLEELKKEHDVVVTIEDGILDGGFRRKDSEILWRLSCKGIKLRT